MHFSHCRTNEVADKLGVESTDAKVSTTLSQFILVVLYNLIGNVLFKSLGKSYSPSSIVLYMIQRSLRKLLISSRTRCHL